MQRYIWQIMIETLLMFTVYERYTLGNMAGVQNSKLLVSAILKYYRNKISLTMALKAMKI